MERDGAAPSDAAVVRVLNADGRPEGAGFLGGHREVITCAHVVGRALGSSSPSSAEPPAGRLWVDFPLARPGLRAEVRVVSWVPVQPDGSGDIAVLRLLADPPARATVARLVEDVAGPDLRVRTFGFPPAYDDGAWSVGRLRARTATGWLQYDTDPASEHRVRTGFSGAPVWDVAGGRCGGHGGRRGQQARRSHGLPHPHPDAAREFGGPRRHGAAPLPVPRPEALPGAGRPAVPRP
ncbi:serine protease [Streptomyces sp. NPDC056600]|uniref:S1 family peptidase n=1 Tax=Streptomyces sp. NPDC056600 TaxID=3345874 RepID=UPI0036B2A71A